MVEQMPEPNRYSPEDEEKIKEAGLQTLYRLNRLTENGFRVSHKPVRYGDDPLLTNSSVELEHPRVQAAYLHADGRIQVHDGGQYVNVERWESDRFHSFLHRVPKPTWWDENKYMVFYSVFAAVVLIAWIVSMARESR